MENPVRQHTSRGYDVELEDVRQRVMAMGGLVEHQIVDATRALMELNTALAEEVIARDRSVNDAEVGIDEDCSRILARRQPTAGDLRLVYSVIKTITDLERIGDEARRIALMAVDLRKQEGVSTHMGDVAQLSGRVSGMVHSALDAFARMDADVAVRVTVQDRSIDRDYEALLRQCITFMMEDPRTIRRIMDVVWCVRALERIGDHAKNIAQYVVYLVKGKDVRHLSVESMEQRIHG